MEPEGLPTLLIEEDRFIATADPTLYIERLIVCVLHGVIEIIVILDEVVTTTGKPADSTVLALNQNDGVTVPDEDVFLQLSLLNVIVLMNLSIRKYLSEPGGDE